MQFTFRYDRLKQFGARYGISAEIEDVAVAIRQVKSGWGLLRVLGEIGDVFKQSQQLGRQFETDPNFRAEMVKEVDGWFEFKGGLTAKVAEILDAKAIKQLFEFLVQPLEIEE